jgi:hypothetical protein
MNRFFVFILLLFFVLPGRGQEDLHKSIHQIQQEYYQQIGTLNTDQYDSINEFKSYPLTGGDEVLEKRVFGYHPYWGGSNYLNYHWNLLSDFCHFSYEVDPQNGFPLTTHEWNVSPAVDSALANGVRAHLCVTLFGSHSTFFNSTSAQQNLIDNLIELVGLRNAHGINMDVEALPSSLGDEYTAFMINLAQQFHGALPGAEVSMAIPAVDWNGTTNFALLKDYVDFFMVMAYDYYWNGSSQAGPVGGLYTMNPGYDYNVSKSISYYQSLGIENEQLLIGMPYYGREWETEGQYAPSNVTGYGANLTYANIRNNPYGYYEPENRHIDPNSLAVYYSFETSGWNQCFIDEPYSLGRKYDIVNRRDLAGIGIWALGYDNGYDDLWNIIAEKFSDEAEVVFTDTIYDSGGPGLNYYNDESYLFTIKAPENHKIELSFTFIDLEAGYDSLWIYDGLENNSLLLGSYSGNETPSDLVASSGLMTLQFYSDIATVGQGWKAVFQISPITGINSSQIISDQNNVSGSPNPFKDHLTLFLPQDKTSLTEIGLIDINGRKLFIEKYNSGAITEFKFPQSLISRMPKGIYFVFLKGEQQYIVKKVIKN